MKELVTDRFVINFQEGLEGFIKNSLKIVEQQMPLLEKLFLSEVTEVEKLKASFFITRKDFVEYIKSISNGRTPPEWATGCFYNGEIQTLLNINNEEDMKYKIYTLTHEMVHLYIQKLVYEKYKIDRIRWFDESYASYIGGHIKNMTKQKLQTICEQLKTFSQFDLNILDDIKKVRTTEYDGYNMFLVIGKYLFENNLDKDYIELLKINPEEIRKEGKSILKKAIEYVLKSL
ncbi:MAG: hypothetical protein E7359_01535 [Clostridiales bacterium]|nr:hypothetical protein [Clostridiales bacterium]